MCEFYCIIRLRNRTGLVRTPLCLSTTRWRSIEVMKIKPHALYNSALDGGECSAHAPASLSRVKSTLYLLDRRMDDFWSPPKPDGEEQYPAWDGNGTHSSNTRNWSHGEASSSPLEWISHAVALSHAGVEGNPHKGEGSNMQYSE
jgi:hypothetical protein